MNYNWNADDLPCCLCLHLESCVCSAPHLGESEEMGQAEVGRAGDIVVADIRYGPNIIAWPPHPVAYQGAEGDFVDAVLPKGGACAQGLLLVSKPWPDSLCVQWRLLEQARHLQTKTGNSAKTNESHHLSSQCTQAGGGSCKGTSKESYCCQVSRGSAPAQTAPPQAQVPSGYELYQYV